MSKESRLWIGGSSGLTRTYWTISQQQEEEESSSWIFLGREQTPPNWIQDAGIPYVACDLVELARTTTTSKKQLFLAEVMDQLNDAMMSEQEEQATSRKISQVVVGIRPPLISPRNNAAARVYCDDMVKGLDILLNAVVEQQRPDLILHVSSIAAVGHLDSQHLQAVSPDDPPSHALCQPYDRFKRACEELITELCTEKSIRFTNLRFSAIFSEDRGCLQCFLLSFQNLGPYVPTLIDYNSCHNASMLICLILNNNNSQKPLLPVYYYTRCLSSYPSPVPYGEFMLSYRCAHGLNHLPLIVPMSLVDWCIIRPLHWLVVVLGIILSCMNLPMLPYLESLDYLLQMTFVEHTFDMTEIAKDFPELLEKEETAETSFSRRRAILYSCSPIQETL